MSAGRTRFVVARVGWRVNAYSEVYTSMMSDFRDTADPEDRRFVPVVAFADRASAEARAGELELDAARVFNPFWVPGPFAYRLDAPEPVFRDRLAALVGPLPDTPFDTQPRTEWLAWWDEHAPEWQDDTLAAVWELFDKMRFYAVLEVEAGDE